MTAAKTVFIRTFGCQMNERDSEIMAQLLGRCDCRLVSVPEAADLVLVNTCSIRDKAEQKVYSLLGHLRDVQAKYGRRAGLAWPVAWPSRKANASLSGCRW